MTKQTITLTPTNNKPPVIFSGELIASVSTKTHEDKKRWAELHAYRTKNGKLIVEQVGNSQVEGEERYSTVLIFKDEQAMTRRLGAGPLASNLYELIGITELHIS